MNPTLPGALIERERICDECSCPSADCEDLEVTLGEETYCLCPDCRDQYGHQIRDTRALASANQAAEDAAQEGE